METLSKARAHGGTQGVYRHASSSTGTDMTFAVFVPRLDAGERAPVLWYLSGLTCNHENAMTKGGFQEHAAREGIALVFPDTSPRGENVADDEAYDLGQGAGFYVNATCDPWRQHYRMYDYIVNELYAIISETQPVQDRHGITGHSMGGHGALTVALNLGAAEATVAVGGQNLTLKGLGGEYTNIFLPLSGAHQARNAATALAAVEAFFGEVAQASGADDRLDGFVMEAQEHLERLEDPLGGTESHSKCSLRYLQ